MLTVASVRISGCLVWYGIVWYGVLCLYMCFSIILFLTSIYSRSRLLNKCQRRVPLRGFFFTLIQTMRIQLTLDIKSVFSVQLPVLRLFVVNSKDTHDTAFHLDVRTFASRHYLNIVWRKRSNSGAYISLTSNE